MSQGLTRSEEIFAQVAILKIVSEAGSGKITTDYLLIKSYIIAELKRKTLTELEAEEADFLETEQMAD